MYLRVLALLLGLGICKSLGGLLPPEKYIALRWCQYLVQKVYVFNYFSDFSYEIKGFIPQFKFWQYTIGKSEFNLSSNKTDIILHHFQIAPICGIHF